MISDLERQTLAELRNRGVTVLPYPQGMLASVRRAEQKILDVNGQGGRQLRKSARQLQHVPLK